MDRKSLTENSNINSEEFNQGNEVMSSIGIQVNFTQIIFRASAIVFLYIVNWILHDKIFITYNWWGCLARTTVPNNISVVSKQSWSSFKYNHTNS